MVIDKRYTQTVLITHLNLLDDDTATYNSVKRSIPSKRTRSIMTNASHHLMSQQLAQVEADIREEERKIALVERSVRELKKSHTKYDNLKEEDFDDGTEWKVRHDTQREYNDFLNKQIKKLEQAVNTGKPEVKALERQLNEMSDSEILAFTKKLEKEKSELMIQLRDYQFRLEQESKALYLAIEERRHLLADINHTKHETAGMTAVASQWWGYKV